MAKRSEFVEHVVETLRAFGPVEARSMFGGWGLYHRGLFFALVAEDTLYFKVDGGNLAEFERAGLEPFTYAGYKDRVLVMSYRRAPEEALESPEVMARWARSGYGAALRSAAEKSRGKRDAGAKAEAKRAGKAKAGARKTAKGRAKRS